MGYYWPTLFRDTKKYVQSCDSYQRKGKPTQADEMPLQAQLVVDPFDRWALDFVGPLNPPSNNKTYILVYTNYVTKWVEAKALTSATEVTVIDFLFEEIFVQFEVPK